MSSLKVNQIKTKLRGMFESHLDLSDIPAHDLERDNKILSRCLAALAIYGRAHELDPSNSDYSKALEQPN